MQSTKIFRLNVHFEQKGLAWLTKLKLLMTSSIELLSAFRDELQKPRRTKKQSLFSRYQRKQLRVIDAETKRHSPPGFPSSKKGFQNLHLLPTFQVFNSQREILC